ncbi:transposable element Tcb1 transposase [Trichonephila clavipes]|nr:transposable element Tcb1 transposase [Trichonephila clavipes]
MGFVKLDHQVALWRIKERYRNRSTCWTKPRHCDAIRHLWMREEMTDRRSLSQLPRCTTTRDDGWIVLMAVMNVAATSRTIAQLIQYVTRQSVSTRTIRRHLQQSGMSVRCPLLRIPVTGNH